MKQNPTTDKLLLRPAEVAEQLGVSRSYCYTLLKTKLLPSIKIGGSVRVPTTQLKQWIDDHTVGQ